MNLGFEERLQKSLEGILDMSVTIALGFEESCGERASEPRPYCAVVVGLVPAFSVTKTIPLIS